MKNTKKALVSASLALLLCFAMLVGTTFAWFTDSVTSANNIIKSGKLNIDLQMMDDAGAYQSVNNAPVFNYQLWEPGYTEWKNLKVTTTGNLALKYTMKIVANGTVSALADVIDVYYAASEVAKPATRDLTGLNRVGTLKDVLNGTVEMLPDGQLIPGTADANGVTASAAFTLALHMQESAGNEYQDLAIGTNFSLQLLATQYTYEADGFNNQYDALADGTPDQADFPVQTATQPVVDGQPTVVHSGPVTATVPANSNHAAADDSLTLTVAPGNEDANLQVQDGDSTTTYEVTLTNQDGEKVTNTTEGIKVALDIGVVDLQAFYHKTTALTKVDNEGDLAINKYFYDQTTGIVTFITDSFSPFTAEYKFAGGIGTEQHPYEIDRYDYLVNIDVGIGNRYPETGTDKVYYKLLNDIDVAAEDGSSWAHSFLYADPRTFAIDMNGKTIALGAKNLYGYARNLEIYNGTFTFSGVGTSVVGYACYQDVDSYSINFHDLTLTGNIANNGGSHYGPLVSYAFGAGLRSGDRVVVNADNIVNNLTIASSNSNGYVGGLFGYVQGEGVYASVTNCTFNGSISAPHVGGFINTCSSPNGASVVSNGNVMNGSLFGTADARAFGCNSNLTGGNTALTALNNSVTLGANASMVTLAPSTDLISISADKKISFKAVDGAASYRAAVVFSVGAGYPRFITEDYPENGSATYETGLYQYAVKNETSDGSTDATRISGSNATVIWLADGAYHCYSDEFDVSSTNVTIYVYAYNASGDIVAYQSVAYANN